MVCCRTSVPWRVKHIPVGGGEAWNTSGPRPACAGVQPVNAVERDPGTDRQGLRGGTAQRVRLGALCAAVLAGRVSRRCAGGFLYAGAGARRDARCSAYRRQRAFGREPAAQQCDMHLLASRGRLLDHANRRNDAMGGVAGRAVSAHACAGQHTAAPEEWVGERRMDGGHA